MDAAPVATMGGSKWVVVFACLAGCQAEPVLGSDEFALANAAVDIADPSVVYLSTIANRNSGRPLYGDCSGSLVAARAVLTARHCVVMMEDRLQDNLRAGYRYPAGDVIALITARVGPNQQPLRVRSIVTHPNADLAILELEQAALAPVLPIFRSSMANLAGASARLVGFGVTGEGAEDAGTKRSGTTTVIGTRIEELFPADQLAALSNDGELFLTGDGPGQSGARHCVGDSGGPVFLMDPATGAEAVGGVISSGFGPCGGAPAIDAAVAVSEYAGWIDETLRDMNADGAATGGGCSTGGDASLGALLLALLMVVVRGMSGRAATRSSAR